MPHLVPAGTIPKSSVGEESTAMLQVLEWIVTDDFLLVMGNSFPP